MTISIANAQIVLAGREPLFWVFLNANYSNGDWNTAVTAYQTLETELDNATLTGLFVAPNRPNPQPRP